MQSNLPVLLSAAPELIVQRWFNTKGPISLEQLRGQVVALHAFQMLCPGCVAHGLPQAQRMHTLFGRTGVQVLGLHTVFEHHEVMEQPAALEAFIHEYRLSFPIGADKPNGRVPTTMQTLNLQGTPSVVLIDKQGRVRMHEFGRVDDLAIGAAVGQLLAEPGPACTDDGCKLQR